MDHAYKDLAVELVEAFVRGGKERPVLPAGRREEAIALLTRLMVNPQLLKEYAAGIEAERRRLDVHRVLMELDSSELPVEAIAERGLSPLGDEQLAELAIEPVALACLCDFLWESMEDGKVGNFWWEQLGQEARRMPLEPGEETAEETIRRIKEVDAKLKAASISWDDFSRVVDQLKAEKGPGIRKRDLWPEALSRLTSPNLPSDAS